MDAKVQRPNLIASNSQFIFDNTIKSKRTKNEAFKFLLLYL